MNGYWISKANIPRSQGDYSFSVTVDKISNIVGIGLATLATQTDNQLGYDDGSISYDSNGLIRFNNSLMSQNAASYTLNDTITVRYIFYLNRVMFYKNEVLAYIANNIQLGFVYPAVCLTGDGDTLTGNFGQFPLFLPPGSRSWDRRRINSTETDVIVQTTQESKAYSISSVIVNTRKTARPTIFSVNDYSIVTSFAKVLRHGNAPIQSLSSLQNNVSLKKRATVSLNAASNLVSTATKIGISGANQDGVVSIQILSSASFNAKRIARSSEAAASLSSLSVNPKAIKPVAPLSPLSSLSSVTAVATAIPNKVTNGSFNNLTGWSGYHLGSGSTVTPDNTVMSMVGGNLRLTSAAAKQSPIAVFPVSSLVVGQSYHLTLDYNGTNGPLSIRVTSDAVPLGSANEVYNSGSLSNASQLHAIFVASQTTMYIYLCNNNSGAGFSEYDNVRVIDASASSFRLREDGSYRLTEDSNYRAL